jgi:hypothetical protein
MSARLLPGHVHEYLAALNYAATVVYHDDAAHAFLIDKNGRKYLRVTHFHNGSAQNVHAFIDKSNGDLLKPGGINGPQRGINGLAVRGNLANDEERSLIITKIHVFPKNVHGHYLYK